MSQNRGQVRKREGVRSGQRSGWIMLLAGILIGTLGTAFYNGIRSGEPDRWLGSGLNQLLETPRQEGKSLTKASEQLITAQEPARTTFDFFTVLPEIERLIPETENSADPPSEAETPSTQEEQVELRDSGSYYMLQVASYTSSAEADQMKVKLAKAGFTSSIQHISIQNQGDFYRVRVGPFFTMSELEKVNVLLSRIGIDALRLKVSRPRS